jgi:hypothetical protein
MLSKTDAKELLRLCKGGRLFDVQNWIESGKSLCVPSDLRATPLKVALDSGFHSLVEVLLQNEPNQELKNLALCHSLSLKRLDFIELLVSYGADLGSIPFIEVLRIWDPTIILFFLDHGADFIQDSPFAVAFGERIRTAIGAWRECRENHHLCASLLQEQAGANPRSSGPTLDNDEDVDDSEHTTAFEAAAHAKSLEILKRLKPDPERTILSSYSRLPRRSAVSTLCVISWNLEQNRMIRRTAVPLPWIGVCQQA